MDFETNPSKACCSGGAGVKSKVNTIVSVGILDTSMRSCDDVICNSTGLSWPV